MPTHWHPCTLLRGKPTNPYALVILNQPINNNALAAVIDGASLLLCADGGANRLFQYETESNHAKVASSNSVNGDTRGLTRLPDAIVGDLDSLDKDVEAHYRGRGVQVVKDPDQYSTDFTKCLIHVREWVQSRPQWNGVCHNANQDAQGDTMDVVVLGGLGGRVDQGFSQIHHLYMAEKDPSLLNGRIYLLSEQSLSFVLSSVSSSDSTGSTTQVAENNSSINTNVIHIQPGCFAENIGILPVLGRTLLTTRGLEWDVKDWPTEFGGQVSTSNHIRADEIEIEFQGPSPLFTLELNSRLTASGE